MFKIGIIGPNFADCSIDLYNFGVELGYKLCKKDRVFICGGLGGFMEAVCKGIKSNPETFSGQTIGILPGSNTNEANSYIDVSIATNMGESRNIIIILSSDVIITAGGGIGTLSEYAFAIKYNKPILVYKKFFSWANILFTDLAKEMLNISYNKVYYFHNLTEIEFFLNEFIKYKK